MLLFNHFNGFLPCFFIDIQYLADIFFLTCVTKISLQERHFVCRKDNNFLTEDLIPDIFAWDSWEKAFSIKDIKSSQSLIQGLVWAHWCYRNVVFFYTNNILLYCYTFKQTWVGDPGMLKVFNPNVLLKCCAEDMIKWLMLFCISSPLIWAPKTVY